MTLAELFQRHAGRGGDMAVQDFTRALRDVGLHDERAIVQVIYLFSISSTSVVGTSRCV